MIYSSITKVSSDHNVWLGSLDFYKDEIREMKRKLQEIAVMNSPADLMKQVEHFQNQFIVQRNNLDELKRGLHHYSDDLAKKDAALPGNNIPFEKNTLKEKYEDFERVMNGLRHEFNDFLKRQG